MGGYHHILRAKGCYELARLVEAARVTATFSRLAMTSVLRWLMDEISERLESGTGAGNSPFRTSVKCGGHTAAASQDAGDGSSHWRILHVDQVYCVLVKGPSGSWKSLTLPEGHASGVTFPYMSKRSGKIPALLNNMLCYYVYYIIVLVIKLESS